MQKDKKFKKNPQKCFLFKAENAKNKIFIDFGPKIWSFFLYFSIRFIAFSIQKSGLIFHDFFENIFFIIF